MWLHWSKPLISAAFGAFACHVGADLVRGYGQNGEEYQRLKRKRLDLRVGTLSVQIMTEKTKELVDMMQRRKVDIVSSGDQVERQQS